MKRLTAAFLLVGIAFAVDYRIDNTSGPLDLNERVAAAFAQWQQVQDAEVSSQEVEDARTLIAYGNPNLFGPDTLSLTVSRGQGEGRALEIRLNPEARTLLNTAILHETGILLGLTPADTGVMNPRFGPQAPAELAPPDRAALQEQRQYAPEDVNRDGVVNFYDLVAVAREFGRSGVNLPADINGDGTVNRQDLARLEEAYVFSAPSETPPGDAQTTDEEQTPVGDEEGQDVPEGDFEGDFEDDFEQGFPEDPPPEDFD